jgi:hypothetical protein
MPKRSLKMRRLLLALAILGAVSLPALGARADEVTFDVRLERGRAPANMRLIRVRQGDVVKLRWSSDRRIVLHLHGYDIETKVEPGTIAEMVFTARATGRFSIEPHTPKGGGGHDHGAVVVRIEVHPH